jgi:hypothetical protein
MQDQLSKDQPDLETIIKSLQLFPNREVTVTIDLAVTIGGHQAQSELEVKQPFIKSHLRRFRKLLYRMVVVLLETQSLIDSMATVGRPQGHELLSNKRNKKMTSASRTSRLRKIRKKELLATRRMKL